jgi:hypothetical protein
MDDCAGIRHRDRAAGLDAPAQFGHAPERTVTARANPPPEAREYTDQLYYDAPVFSTTLLRWLVEDVGVKHVLLRADHPFELRDMDPLETGAGLGCPGLRSRRASLGCGGERTDRSPRFMR